MKNWPRPSSNLNKSELLTNRTSNTNKSELLTNQLSKFVPPSFKKDLSKLNTKSHAAPNDLVYIFSHGIHHERPNILESCLNPASIKSKFDRNQLRGQDRRDIYAFMLPTDIKQYMTRLDRERAAKYGKHKFFTCSHVMDILSYTTFHERVIPVLVLIPILRLDESRTKSYHSLSDNFYKQRSEFLSQPLDIQRIGLNRMLYDELIQDCTIDLAIYLGYKNVKKFNKTPMMITDEMFERLRYNLSKLEYIILTTNEFTNVNLDERFVHLQFGHEYLPDGTRIDYTRSLDDYRLLE